MKHWLLKSEPESYSIDHLERDGETCWDGVRNYQARNFMRDDMKPGDRVLFYHSNANPPAVAGIAEVSRAAYPDPSALNRKSAYHDPKASAEDPRWFMVDIRFVEKLPREVSLAELKADPKLADMLVTGGSRLSVQPVERKHFQRVLQLARRG
ncbi:MAG: EVE domain-containing protein [Gemmatimonadota bacterium]